MTPTTERLPGPAAGERVVVQLLTGNGRRRTVDRGELVSRRTFIAVVRSDQDGRIRRWRLIDHLCRAE